MTSRKKQEKEQVFLFNLIVIAKSQKITLMENINMFVKKMTKDD